MSFSSILVFPLPKSLSTKQIFLLSDRLREASAISAVLFSRRIQCKWELSPQAWPQSTAVITAQLCKRQPIWNFIPLTSFFCPTPSRRFPWRILRHRGCLSTPLQRRTALVFWIDLSSRSSSTDHVQLIAAAQSRLHGRISTPGSRCSLALWLMVGFFFAM